MGKLTISMAIFNSYVKLPEGISFCHGLSHWTQKNPTPLVTGSLEIILISEKWLYPKMQDPTHNGQMGGWFSTQWDV